MSSRKYLYVRPRVTTEFSSDSVLLVDALRALDEVGKSRMVAIVGRPGSGKSTAIEHLLMVQPIGNVVYCDDPSDKSLLELQAKHFRLIVFTAEQRKFPEKTTVVQLAPWGRD